MLLSASSACTVTPSDQRPSLSAPRSFRSRTSAVARAAPATACNSWASLRPAAGRAATGGKLHAPRLTPATYLPVATAGGGSGGGGGVPAAGGGGGGGGGGGDEESLSLGSAFPGLVLWAGSCAGAWWLNGRYIKPKPALVAACCAGKKGAAKAKAAVVKK